MIRFEIESRRLSMGVGDLVRYGAPPAVRLAPSARARLQAGAAEHASWRQECEAEAPEEEFQAEVSVAARLDVDGFEVFLEGRLDGLRREAGRWVVEEVKTVILAPWDFDLESLTSALGDGGAFADYRFQLEVYLFLIAEGGLESAPAVPRDLASGGSAGGASRGRLIFRNLAGGASERQIAVELEPELAAVRERVLARLRAILGELLDAEDRRRSFEAAAGSLPFPFAAYRPFQAELAAAVREALEAGEHLLLAAATGIGKTAAVLHAALAHALASGRRVFWVTSKNTQQRLVVETLERLRRAWLEGGCFDARRGPRAVVLRAREKVCLRLEEGGAVVCDPACCRFARGFGKKLDAGGVLSSLRQVPVLAPEDLCEVGAAHEVCPHELSLLLAAEVDLVVGDYNYIFDPGSALRGLLQGQLLRQAVLVIDEAQNLPGRGRQQLSASLSAAALRGFRDASRWQGGELGEALMACAERLVEWFGAGEEAGGDPTPSGAARASKRAGPRPVEVDREALEALDAEVGALRARCHLEGGAMASSLAASESPLERVAADLGALAAALRRAGDGVPVATVVEPGEGGPVLRALCLDASRVLGERIGQFHAAIAMSGTLEPVEFFRDALGFPRQRTRAASFPSPFPRRNRGIFIDPSIETTFKRRSRDAAKVARRVDEIAALRRGNYLVFLPSYRYLDEVLRHVDRDRPDREIIVQTPSLREEERDSILERLREPGSARILYGVQGGIFSEGVDYPGDMAIGVVVVGPGLPAVDPEQELLRRHFDALDGRGFERAYLNPGMQRVVQAAGRVHRGPEDVGIIVLLGERFAERRYSRLLPADWFESGPEEAIAGDLCEAIRGFWEKRCQEPFSGTGKGS